MAWSGAPFLSYFSKARYHANTLQANMHTVQYTTGSLKEEGADGTGRGGSSGGRAGGGRAAHSRLVPDVVHFAQELVPAVKPNTQWLEGTEHTMDYNSCKHNSLGYLAVFVLVELPEDLLQHSTDQSGY